MELEIDWSKHDVDRGAEMNESVLNMKKVSVREHIPFRCIGCGACCRHVRQSVPLESLDVFRLAKYLRDAGADIRSADDFLAQYAEPVLLDECGYTMYMLVVTGADDACIFLKNSRCTVHQAKPRACRLYPFAAGPDEKGGWEYLVSQEKRHHFKGASVHVKTWMKKYLTEEDRAFLRLDYNSVKPIARLLRRIPEPQLSAALMRFMYFKYSAFELDKPFLPQYSRNLKQLQDALAELANET